MRRNGPPNLDGVDRETREAVEAAARRSGLGPEEWISAALADQDVHAAPTGARRGRRRGGDELEAAITKIAKVTRQRPSGDFEAIIATAAVESDRQARDQAARTAVALDSVATWIEEAEGRLAKATRSSSEQQDQLALALTDALGVIKTRLDTVEQQVAGDSAPARRRMAGPPAADPKVEEAFASLRDDMARLIARVEEQKEDPWIEVIDTIHADVERLQGAMSGLATRDEIAAIEHHLVRLAEELIKSGRHDVQALAGALAALERQVGHLSEEVGGGVQRRVQAEIDRLVRKVDHVAANGVDRSVVEGVRAELAEMRQALAELAEPHRIERLSEAISLIGRQVVEVKANQVGRNDFVGMRAALEEMRTALERSEDARAASLVPEQLLSLSRRVDVLMSRPAPAAIEPISHQVAALADGLSAIASNGSDHAEHLAGLMEKLSGQMGAMSDHVRAPPRDVIDRLATIESGVRQVGQAADRLQAPPKEVLERLERIEGGVRQFGQAADRQAPKDVLDRLLRIEGGVRHVAQAADRLQAPQKDVVDRLERIEGGVRQVGEFAAHLRAPPKEMLARLERLESGVRHVGELAGHLRTPSKDLVDRLERIEDGIRQVGQDADTANIELMLRSVQQRLEQAPMSQTALDGLEKQIGALTIRLDSLGPAGPLQHLVNETLAQVKGLREDTDEIAERAAKAALKEMVRILPQPGGLSDLDALKQGFIEIKALQEGADRRTQQTLKAVHNALETLVNRLPPQNIATMTASGTSPRAPATGEGGDTPPAARLEAAVRKLHAAAVSHVEEVASTPVDSTFPTEPEEILIEPGAPRAAPNVQVAAVASSQEAQPASVRANFIAAARRAAQAVQAEKDAGSQVSEPEDAPGNEGPNPPISNQTLIERIRQTFDHHRRPLLLTLAFLVLAAGAAQIVAGMRKAEGSPPMQPVASEQAPAPAPVPELPKTAIGKASQVEPGTPVITGSLLQPPPVASPISANAFSTVKRIPDVAAVGDLPTSIPPGLREAALAGDAAAVYEVASRASDGRDGAPDPTLAARLFEKAAKAGLAPAQYRLGNLYEKGLAVPRDAAAAKSWYERAAASGNARSMHNLGVLLAEGVDGKPEYAIAQKWFLAAAELGVRDSQYNLGVLLVRGLGIGQDLAQSYKWFALAARQGDEDAGRKRDEVAARLTPADLAAQKAVVESWRAREPGQAANEAPPPPQGWSAIRPVKGRG